MPNVFSDIRVMHKFYGIDTPSEPSQLTPEIAEFRIKFLLEELTEFISANIRGDLPEQVDALIDLMVVASGTLHMMGVLGELHWEEVHRCNMRKEVVKNASESKRGSSIDLKKPEGWKPPNHERILSYQYMSENPNDKKHSD